MLNIVAFLTVTYAGKKKSIALFFLFFLDQLVYFKNIKSLLYTNSDCRATENILLVDITFLLSPI